MEFSLSTSCHNSFTTHVIVWFCVLWPFATLTFLHRRQTSPAPVLSVLLAVAVAECGLWIGLANTLLGLSYAGNWRGAAAAGIAEALAVLTLVPFSAALIAIFAMIRRHRPSIDRVTALFAAVLLLEIGAAMIFATRIAPSIVLLRLAMVALGITVFVAFVIAGWLVLIVRGRVHPRPIPYATPVALLLYATMAVIVYREVQRYLQIARFG